MLNDILFIATIFVTRVVLPMTITFVIGALVKRSLRPDLPADLRRWYDRKSFYLQRRGTLEAILFGPELVDQLVEGFVLLAPLYRFLRSD